MPRRSPRAAAPVAAALDAVGRAVVRRLLRDARLFDDHRAARALLTVPPSLPPAAAGPLRAFLGGARFYVPSRSAGASAAATVRAALRSPPRPRPRGRGVAPLDAGFAALRYLTGVASIARRHGLTEPPPPPPPPCPPSARLLRAPTPGAVLLAHPMLSPPFARTAVLLLDAPRPPPRSARAGVVAAARGPAGVVLGETLAGETGSTLQTADLGGVLRACVSRLTAQGARARGGGGTPPSPPRVRVVSVPVAGDGEEASAYAIVAVVGEGEEGEDEEEAFEGLGGGGAAPSADASPSLPLSPAAPPVLELRSDVASAPRVRTASPPSPPPPAPSSSLLPPALSSAPLYWGGPVPSVSAIHSNSTVGGQAIPAPPTAVAVPPRAPHGRRRRRRRRPPSPPPSTPKPLAYISGDVAAATAALPPAAAARGRGARVYVGAAAWGPRQLAAEVAAGGWIVAALPAEVASPVGGGGGGGADGVWAAGLAAVGGETAALARVPVEAVAEAMEVAGCG